MNLQKVSKFGKCKVVANNLVQCIWICDKLIFHFYLGHTSNTICLDDDYCAYRPQGVKCINRMNGLPVGSLEKTFKVHGRAKLTFKNCNDHGFVTVFLNDKRIYAMTRKGDPVSFVDQDDVKMQLEFKKFST